MKMPAMKLTIAETTSISNMSVTSLRVLSEYYGKWQASLWPTRRSALSCPLSLR